MSFHLKTNGTFCTDDARVKVHIFYNIKYFKEALSICSFVCLKMFLTAVI